MRRIGAKAAKPFAKRDRFSQWKRRRFSGGRIYGVRAAVCFVLAFLLICSPSGVWLYAGPGSQDSAASAYAAGSGSSTASSSEKSAPKIQEAMIYHNGKIVGTSTQPDQRDLAIDTKGGTLEFYNRVQWDDYSKEYNSLHVKWSTSDEHVATINDSGVLTAKGNGTVKVIATVDADYSSTGKPLRATATVKITNQKKRTLRYRHSHHGQERESGWSHVYLEGAFVHGSCAVLRER